MTAEGDRVAGFGRLEDGLKQSSPWYTWGPYVSERQGGTVREDYSQDGDAWSYLPHDQARSRAYRWGEDGLAGFSDVEQRLCLGLALWNGRDPPQGAAVRADRPGGQPRGGRQGALVVPGRAAEPRLEPVALPLPAGDLPLRAAPAGELAARPAHPGVRDPRHRGIRPGPVLDHRGRVRQERRRAGIAD